MWMQLPETQSLLPQQQAQARRLMSARQLHPLYGQGDSACYLQPILTVLFLLAIQRIV
ncbi:hypothetical protein SAMN05216255_0977 [Pseudomonas segetis]|uniref:Uncharacterized protein n=1 Tax=Pseudomonas segetis TaxID=298908 RepID=A0A239A7W5_9PSED|nr:hypothetical protein SAMN05216255_0977 [Pseudomonas segetis]